MQTGSVATFAFSLLETRDALLAVCRRFPNHDFGGSTPVHAANHGSAVLSRAFLMQEWGQENGVARGLKSQQLRRPVHPQATERETESPSGGGHALRRVDRVALKAVEPGGTASWCCPAQSSWRHAAVLGDHRCLTPGWARWGPARGALKGTALIVCGLIFSGLTGGRGGLIGLQFGTLPRKPLGHFGGGSRLQLGGLPTKPSGHLRGGSTTTIRLQLGGVPVKPGLHVSGGLRQFG